MWVVAVVQFDAKSAPFAVVQDVIQGALKRDNPLPDSVTIPRSKHPSNHVEAK
jgi:hypothetical protein